MRTNNRERGGALLTVLWLAAALAAIGFSVSMSVRGETERVGAQGDGLRASYLASGSIERAIQWLVWGPDYRNRDGGPLFWEPNLSRMSMHYPSGEAVVELIPESSKMNVNQASPEDLTRLLFVLTGDAGVAQRAAASILFWRQPAVAGAPVAFSPAAGAFGPEAPGQGSPFQTFQGPHASLQEIEELLSVPGITPELFHGNFKSDAEGRTYAVGGLKDSLSVYGSNGPFDVNSASPALLESLGVPTANVSALLRARAIRPLRDLGEAQALGVATPKLGIGGNYIWTLRATARLRRPDGGLSDVVRTAAAVVKLVDKKYYPQMPVHVLRYYDDGWSEFAATPNGQPLAALPGRHVAVR